MAQHTPTSSHHLYLPCVSSNPTTPIPITFSLLLAFTLPRPHASHSGSANCTVCSAGFYCSTPSNLPVACSDGQYSPEGMPTCTSCPAGSYCPGPPFDEDSIAPCPAGLYSLDGTSSCSECPKGFYCPDTSQAPEACPDGYHAYVGNMTACSRCGDELWILTLLHRFHVRSMTP